MKIAQIVCRFKPYKGGISNMAYDYARGLAELGHQVTIFTPLYDQADKEAVFSDFKIKRLAPLLKFGNAAFLPQLFWQLPNFDIIHLHYPFFGGAEVIGLLKLLKGEKLKLVITYHHDVVGNGFLGLFFKLHTRFIMPWIIKLADKVIVTSFDYANNSNIKQLVVKYPHKFIAIPPSVNLQQFKPQEKDPELLAQYNINPVKDRLLVFVGALDQAHYFKGLEFLINSFSNIVSQQQHNFKLKLIIIGGGELKDNYQEQVKDLNLSDQIKFAGKVADSDLSKYYNLADAVILPSIDKSEAFGITLIEAMACAKPVIASDLAGVRSVFEDKISGYVIKVKDAKDLADSVNNLLANQDLISKMGEESRLRAEKLYGHDYLTQKLDKVYSEIINHYENSAD